MKKNIFTFSLSLAAIIFTLSSCVKGEGVYNEPEDITGTWAVTGIRSDFAYDWDGDGFTERDILSTYSYCERDIVLSFDYNGYGQVRQGCNASWQAIYWQLSNNYLRIDLPGDDINLDLTQMSYNTIRGEDRVYIDGRNFVITYTLTRR